MSYTNKTYLWSFLLALSLRILLIVITPSKNNYIDLQIYRDAGQLVVNGVNPYNYNDNVELRQQLRTDKDNFNEWVCSAQDRWDYYANSNLPLATLVFGGLEYCFASTVAFRYFFAFFDSLLAVLILAFVLNKWQYRFPNARIFNKFPPTIQRNLPLLIGLSLVALSPISMLWGTFIPEPKGIGTLLILSSVYFSDSANKKLSMFVSPVLLGFSLAFIGLGVFIGPLCLFNIYKNNSNGFSKIAVYCMVAFLACVICLLPFMPELISMMKGRMNQAVNFEPQHGSMWSMFYVTFPDSWLIIKNVFIGIFAGINIIGFFRKRLNIAILSANLLFLFTVIYLVNGSMDRMNIALITLIILLGSSQLYRITTLLGSVYLIYGAFSFLYSFYFGIQQELDGKFVLSFTVLYFILLLVQIFAKKTSNYEVVSSYTSLQ